MNRLDIANHALTALGKTFVSEGDNLMNFDERLKMFCLPRRGFTKKHGHSVHKRMVYKYPDDAQPTGVILGPRASGKTTEALRTAVEVLERGRDVLYSTNYPRNIIDTLSGYSELMYQKVDRSFTHLRSHAELRIRGFSGHPDDHRHGGIVDDGERGYRRGGMRPFKIRDEIVIHQYDLVVIHGVERK